LNLFQSTPSARRATGEPAAVICILSSFNPRPPHGGRHKSRTRRTKTHCFNPRPPHGGRREAGIVCSSGSSVSIHALRTEGDPRSPSLSASLAQFQSTPSARRATPHTPHTLCTKIVSIHALRTEGDFICCYLFFLWCCFNPRPPHGGRHLWAGSPRRTLWFQSTPSARRATAETCPGACTCEVSIHALRTEGDPPLPVETASLTSFNPRPPHGGRPSP